TAATQYVMEHAGPANEYIAWLYLSQKQNKHLDDKQAQEVAKAQQDHGLNYHRLQIQEALARHASLVKQLAGVVKDPAKKKQCVTERAEIGRASCRERE